MFFKSFKDILAMQKKIFAPDKFLIWFRNFEIALDFQCSYNCAKLVRTSRTCKLSKEERDILVESVIAAEIHWNGYRMNKTNIDLFIEDIERMCHTKIAYGIQQTRERMPDEQIEEINNAIVKSAAERYRKYVYEQSMDW